MSVGLRKEKGLNQTLKSTVTFAQKLNRQCKMCGILHYQGWSWDGEDLFEFEDEDFYGCSGTFGP